ncbi:exodeoxyribonuclease V subunit gamma, partial [Mesorhizobium sp.]
VVHGNRLDELRSLVISLMRRYPLAPLENEIALVQSNGIAQWLKLALAEDPEDDGSGGCGIAAAIDVQLPGSFMWHLYRTVLG